MISPYTLTSETMTWNIYLTGYCRIPVERIQVINAMALCSTSLKLLDDFNNFRRERMTESETFKYWDQFIQLVARLRDLIGDNQERLGFTLEHCTRGFYT